MAIFKTTIPFDEIVCYLTKNTRFQIPSKCKVAHPGKIKPSSMFAHSEFYSYTLKKIVWQRRMRTVLVYNCVHQFDETLINKTSMN